MTLRYNTGEQHRRKLGEILVLASNCHNITMDVVQTVPNSGTPAQWPTVTTNGQLGNETRAGFKPRLVTGVLQTFIGFVLIVCGIVVISARVPDNYSNVSFTIAHSFVDDNDKVGWGIWIGVSVIFASVFGILSKRSQAIISLYMAFSIVVTVMSFVGIWGVATSLTASVGLNNALKSYYSTSNPCGQYKNLYYGNRYPYPYYYDSFSSEWYGYGRQPPQYTYDECIDEITGPLKVHIAIYSVMLVCLVGEFIISIIGAAFTCTGLDCCSSQPRPTQTFSYQTQVLGSYPVMTPAPSYTVQSVYPQHPPPAYNQAWSTAGAQAPLAGNSQWSNPQYKGYAGNQSSPPPATGPAYLEPMTSPIQGSLNNSYDASGDPCTREGNDEYYVTVTE